MNIIRKISIGQNYPDGVMHYQVGKSVKLNGVYFEVSMILPVVVSEELTNYDVYLKEDNANVLWKTISGVPVVVEYKIDFE